MVSIPSPSGRNVTDLLYCTFYVLLVLLPRVFTQSQNVTVLLHSEFYHVLLVQLPQVFTSITLLCTTTLHHPCNTQYLTQHFNTPLTSSLLLQSLQDIPCETLSLLSPLTFSLILLLYKKQMCFFTCEGHLPE